ncbi:hypothetical protein BDW60DRAFT_207346 [Aspergillus nidulans var. acristatus]
MSETLKHNSSSAFRSGIPRVELEQIIQIGADAAERLHLIRAMTTIRAEIHRSATLLSEGKTSGDEYAMAVGASAFRSLGRLFGVLDGYFHTVTGITAARTRSSPSLPKTLWEGGCLWHHAVWIIAAYPIHSQ